MRQTDREKIDTDIFSYFVEALGKDYSTVCKMADEAEHDLVSLAEGLESGPVKEECFITDGFLEFNNNLGQNWCNSLEVGAGMWGQSADPDDQALKNEPIGLDNMDYCPQPSLDESFNRDFADYPSADDGSDQGLNDVTMLDSNSEHNCAADRKRLCLVCEDAASGCHYGILSCEACKAFFKRTVQGNIEYTCRKNGNCRITKHHRKTCQHCRYHKCLKQGMLREGVRLDRVRGGRQKYRKVANAVSAQPLVSVVRSPLREAPLTDNRLATLLAQEEQQQTLFANVDYDQTEVGFFATLASAADCELISVINWAKHVPGFSSLDLTHQMELLQNCWLDIMCLNLIHRSCPHNEEVRFAQNLCLSEDKATANGFPSELYRLVRNVCVRYTNLSVTREEYVLLKAILLCTTVDTDEERKSLSLGNLRDKLHDSLHDLVSARFPSCHLRLGNLFLLFPHIINIKSKYELFLIDLTRNQRVVLPTLLGEMLGC